MRRMRPIYNIENIDLLCTKLLLIHHEKKIRDTFLYYLKQNFLRELPSIDPSLVYS